MGSHRPRSQGKSSPCCCRGQFGLAVSCNILSETFVSVDAPSAIFPPPLRKISKMSLILWRRYNNTYKTLIITTLLITLINATLRICFCLMFYGKSFISKISYTYLKIMSPLFIVLSIVIISKVIISIAVLSWGLYY